MKLSIVIPALNEEDSISSIIQRTLVAEEYIVSNTHIHSIEIIVVSDGSTDKTVEIAQSFLPKIKLIVFEKNKGYGAAIKTGWSEASGDYLAFLDADGTCEPNFFANLVNLLKKNDADVVLGCRLNKESKMPLIRRVGNFIFAKMLTFLSSNYVKDTASGMRVVKKSSLKDLYPLPDGLHFTPAMSARALLNSDITIAEEDMPYHEREGESKLSVTKDGVRFLKVILSTAFLYRPQIIINVLSILFLLVSFLIMFQPILNYIESSYIEDWMIYRFIFAEVFGVLSFILFSFSFLLQNAVQLSLNLNKRNENAQSIAAAFFKSKFSLFLGLFFLILGFTFISGSLLDRLESGHTNEHWSRYIAFSFFEIIGLLILATRWSKYVFKLLKDRLIFIQSEEYEKL
jgi:glycosyltransferase involved in cell wall biosynthesis